MSSKAELVEYIAEQCSGAGNITTRKMFGEYGIYCDGKIFGLICDNQLFIKITEKGKNLMLDLEKGVPYKGASAMIL